MAARISKRMRTKLSDMKHVDLRVFADFTNAFDQPSTFISLDT